MRLPVIPASVQENGVDINEVYRNYTPPIPVREVVEQMLATTPAEYLAGLKTVVITNSAALSYARRKGSTRARGRNVRLAQAAGFYYREKRGDSASIELIADNIVNSAPRWAMQIPVIRDVMVGTAFFRELGNHLQTVGIQGLRKPQNGAEGWSSRLTKRFLARRYWYLRPLFTLAAPAARFAHRRYLRKQRRSVRP